LADFTSVCIEEYNLTPEIRLGLFIRISNLMKLKDIKQKLTLKSAETTENRSEITNYFLQKNKQG